MNPRQIRGLLRHAIARGNAAVSRNPSPHLDRSPRQRLGRLRVLSVSAIGAASIATAVAGQSLGPQPTSGADSVPTEVRWVGKGGLVLSSQEVSDKGMAVDLRDSAAAESLSEWRMAMDAATVAPASAVVIPGPGSPLAGAVPATAVTPTPTAAAATAAEPKAASADKPAPEKLEIYHLFQMQINGYYCGPAAARIAVTAHGKYPNQDQLARMLNTTVNGTFSSDDITRALNKVVGTSAYGRTWLPERPATAQQKDELRADVVRAIGKGHPVVVNIVGTARDTGGTAHSYPGGHYLTVVGYRNAGQQVKIADPAFGIYWMSTANLANWAGSRGYVS